MPKPGDFMLVATPGWQARGIRIVTHSPVNHGVVLIDDTHIIEADPSGARINDLAVYDGMPQWWSVRDASDRQRSVIVAAAYSHVGDPYSWIDDACIGLTDILGVHVPPYVRERLGRSDRLMCSQLIDRCWFQAGIHLFDDGRLDGDVSPGDLLPFCEVIRP